MKEAGALLAVLTLYLVTVLLQAKNKLIWGDELFTFYIARTGSLHSIWHALAAGADPNPPLIHVAVLLITHFFGMGPLALRLPSILCVGLALVSLWSILRSFVPPGFAVAGLLAFMTTRGFDYSYDARSYAPMMGFGMLGLALWTASLGGPPARRATALLAMGLSLIAGLFSNYYCVLAFFPIAAGQFVDDWKKRRIRWALWLTLLASTLPLLVLLPLIRHNISEFGPHAWNRPHPDMIALSYVELVEGILWPTLFVALMAVPRSSRTLGLPAPFVAALATLLLYPLLGYAVALGGAGMISPRCVAPVCCGVGLLAGIAAYRLFPNSRKALHATLALLLVWFCVRESVCALLLRQQRNAFYKLRDEAARHAADQTVLLADSSLVLPLYFYSAPSIQKEIQFPIDFQRIHRTEADDSGEQNLWAGREGVFPFPVIPYRQIATVPRALVVARPDGWLAQALAGTGAHLQPYPAQPAWNEAGGVFSPMTHPETRFLQLTRQP